MGGEEGQKDLQRPHSVLLDGMPLEHVAIPVQNMPASFNLANQPSMISQNISSDLSPEVHQAKEKSILPYVYETSTHLRDIKKQGQMSRRLSRDASSG